jgi:hypothetical protein
VGSVFGSAKGGAAVTIENPATGTKREITADAGGRFSFSQLAPGSYKITSDGVTRNVDVRVGTGSQVDLSAGQAANIGEVTVVGGGAINPIDVSSVESTTVFTASQIQALPVGRDPSSVALLAPGTVKGDTGFGNLASFGGSSVAENGYYINGFDVTNIFNFLSYASLPFEAISEQQVKTGGYGAEFGRSLGGVINIVTKRGTNEWKAGVSMYWSPEALREHSANVVSKDPLDIAAGDKYFIYREDNKSSNVTYNIFAGGPIVEDRLFVFGLLQAQQFTSDAFGESSSQAQRDSQPNGMIKLDWNISDNHTLEFTGISNRSNLTTVTYNNPAGAKYTGQHGDEASNSRTRSGGETYILKYTGYLTDNFTLSAQYGRLDITTGDRIPALLGSENCPRAFDSRANPGVTVKIGCWLTAATFVRDVTQPKDRDQRDAYRLDAEWRLGDHLVRFGYDHEEFKSRRAGQSYTGGIYYRYFKRATAFTVNGVLLPAGTDYVRTWDFRSLSGDFKVINTASYIEDSWQATDNLLVYGGVRGESFENRNGAGIPFVKSDTLYAPRVGFSWDVKGDASLKVFGNAGRYYIPVASNTNVRGSGGDNTAVNYYHYSGLIDPVTGAPVGGLGTQIGPNDTSFPVAPDPRTVAANNLTPMFQDEFILGFQREMGNNWTLGARAIYRIVKNGMDDYCGHQAFQTWAADNGHTNFDSSTMARCLLINPGKDVQVAVDLENDGNLQVIDVPASYLQMPDYKRSYKALEIFWEKAMSDKWYVQGSYTFAKSYGNVEGYVNSTLEQTDAGVTQDFDHALFEDGSTGNLPNDRRHTFKMFGVYQLTDEWRLGGSMLVQSGRPINCNGYINLDDPRIGIDKAYFAQYAASSFYCKNAAGTSVVVPRGTLGRTPWIYNFDMSIGYVPNWADKHLTLEARIFNIFNIQKVTEFNETSATGSNLAQEEDPNFLNVVNYQAPRSVEFTARYEF